MKTAQNGDTVRVHYTGTLKDGTIFDSSEGREPLEFTIGDGFLMPAFEQGVIGLAEGETKTISVAAEDAFGPRRDKLIGKIPRHQLPDDLIPEVGMQLQMMAPDEQPLIIRIIDVNDEDITVDANHELAGEDLEFHVELVKIL